MSERELARVSDASPLLCVVGAELLVREQISPDGLRTSAVFRDEGWVIQR